MRPMRATVLLAALALPLVAGAASASDYMLPQLLDSRSGFVDQPAGQPPAQAPQSLPPPAQASPLAFGIAAAAAALVTVGAFVWLGRTDQRTARVVRRRG